MIIQEKSPVCATWITFTKGDARIRSHSCSVITNRRIESEINQGSSATSLSKPKLLVPGEGRINEERRSPRELLKYRRSLKLIGVDVENTMKGEEEEERREESRRALSNQTARPRTIKPTMSTRVKMRSVSVEDLGKIVKQMIDGALEDSEQVAKLHQAVYEEWYFKKTAELKKAKTDSTVGQNQHMEKETEGEISAAQISHRIRRPKSARRPHTLQVPPSVESSNLMDFKTCNGPQQPQIFGDCSSTNVRQTSTVSEALIPSSVMQKKKCYSVQQQPNRWEEEEEEEEDNNASKKKTIGKLQDGVHPKRSKTASVHWNPNIITKESYNRSALIVSQRSRANVVKPLRSAVVLRPPEKDIEQRETSPSSSVVSRNTLTTLERESSNEIDAPVVHTLRRSKTSKGSPTIVRLTNRSNPALQADLPDTCTELHLVQRVQTSTNLARFLVVGEDPIEEFVERFLPDPIQEEQVAQQDNEVTDPNGMTEMNNDEMIEIWTNCKPKTVSIQEQNKTRKIKLEFKSRGEIAFENWKREKTKAYNRIIKEQQRKKEKEQAAREIETEKKKAASEAYLRWRKQQETQQKLSLMRKKAQEATEADRRRQSDEKRTANAQAFKAWKRQKDVKLRERRMYMMAYTQQGYQQQQQPQQQQQSKQKKPKPGPNVAFNMWLDQLDCVLHQKYLRERRYLVRSFYCQPAYYGTASMCSR